MITFNDFRKERWKHLTTANVVESPLASVRLRTNAARGFRKIRSATALIWRRLQVAESRFRELNAPHLLRIVWWS
jgi:putative transposase